ncbi:MAG: dihydrofolate reductase [Bacteroidales bacterium]|nr:dihydrofolate reductase [Bacteroidales bacterium]
MELCMIVAVDERNGIGRNNELLCHLSGDLKNFKSLTSGCPVIMGRKTYESLPNGALPKRVNIVLSRDENYVLEDAITCESIEEVLGLRVVKNSQRVFVIGGESIYKAFFEHADKLYVTCIRHHFEDADTFFPEIDIDHWRINSVSDEFKADEKNDYPYFFAVYERIRGNVHYVEDEFNEI